MLALLVLSVVEAQLSCPAYSCHAPGFSFGDVCYSVSDANTTMQLCRDSSVPYCPFVSGANVTSNCTTAPTVEPVPANPGAACSSNSSCTSGVCSESVCTGNATNAACSYDYECGVGLFCASNDTCQAQVVQGGECTIDSQCVNTCGCDKPKFEGPGKCVPYYSLDVKSEVQSCVTQGTEAVSRLCTTGVCTLATPNEDGLGYCASNAVSVDGLAHQCSNNTDCVALRDGLFISGVCECGYSIYGLAYCNAFSGDAPSQTVLSLYVQHLSSPALSTCHTLDRFASDCTSKTLNSTAQTSLIKNSILSEDAPLYQDNDLCTEIILNDAYYNVTVSDLTCPAWSCAASNVNMTGSCLVYTEGTNSVNLNQCTGNTSFCNTTAFYSDLYGDVSCAAAPGLSGLAPGSACSAGSQCYSGNCTSALCVGKASGVKCSQNIDCSVGLYCTPSQTCAKLISAYTQGCYSDYECTIGSSCNIIDATTPGTCLPMFSQPNSTVVPCYFTNGNSTLCSSGACTIVDQVTLSGVCTSPPSVIGTFPKICSSDSDCVGQNTNGQIFYSSCNCGYNTNGYSYCTPFPGDSPAQKFLTTYSKISKSNSPVICQTTTRYTAECIQTLANYSAFNDATAVVQFYNSTSYGDFLDNDACVKATVNSYYWSYTPADPVNPDNPDDDDLGATLVLGVLAFAAWV